MVTRVVPSVVGMTAALVANLVDYATATQTAPASVEIIGLPVQVIQHAPAETTTGTINHALNVMTVRADRQIAPGSARVTDLRVQVHGETRTPGLTVPGATIETATSGLLGHETVLIPTVIVLIGLVAHRALHLTGNAIMMLAPGSSATINPGSSVEIVVQDVATTDHDSSVTMSVLALTETTSLAEQAHAMATHVPASNAGTIRTGDPAAMHRGHSIGMIRETTADLVNRGPVLRAIATTVTDQVGQAGRISQPADLTAPVLGRSLDQIASNG